MERRIRTEPRAVRVALAAVLVAVVLAGAPAVSSADEYGDAAYVVAMTNDERASYGSAPLAVDGHLEWVASSWAAELASNGYVAHNPRPPYEVDGWWVLGENVGRGGSVEAIHQAWVNSWSHYANLVEPDYNSVGVGVAYGGNGLLYVVQVFAGF